MTMWFLIAWGGVQFIGPLPEKICRDMVAIAQDRGEIECREAVALTGCPVPDHPGSYMTCPVFDLPKVMVRPDK